MANSIAFSIGSGGCSVIKSIQKIPVSLGDVEITEYRDGGDVYSIDVPVGRIIDPDKSIVILPQHIIGMDKYNAAGSGSTQYTLYSTVPMLYEISEDQITILIEQTDSIGHSALDRVTFVADVYNIIQIIEFE